MVLLIIIYSTRNKRSASQNNNK